MLGPREAFVLEILKKDLDSMKDEELIIWLLETYAKLQFLEQTTEITKLSMIVGDTSLKVNMRQIFNDLNESANPEE